jgi:putative methylase
MISKKALNIHLSKLKLWEKPDVKLEQYPTPGDIAADILWNAHMNSDIENKTIIDAACGPGILGIGALMLGAKKVYFVDKDTEALGLVTENQCFTEDEFVPGKHYESELILSDIAEINIKADVVIQNPPFGTKDKHADKAFLEQAFKSADVIYSFHKTSTKSFVEAIAKDNGFEITHVYKYNFPIKATMKFHKKPVKMIEVGCWRLKRKE